MHEIGSLSKKCSFKATEYVNEVGADIAMVKAALEFQASVIAEKLERTGEREKLREVPETFSGNQMALPEFAVDIIDPVLEVTAIQMKVNVLEKLNARMKGDTHSLRNDLDNKKIIFKCAGYRELA